METTPWHVWHVAVYEIAKVDVHDAEKYGVRERMGRWYSDGMPAWMAADSARAFVQGGKKADAGQCDTLEELRRVIRSAVIEYDKPR
jgi:hypothetical protein